MTNAFSPVITLLTDFGTSDTYVGQMKGRLLQQCPQTQLIDLTHQIPPQNLSVAAYQIFSARQAFCEGTVHLVVVDPGVGTHRGFLIAETDGQTFVAPDNGVLELVLTSESTIRRLTASEVVANVPNLPSSGFISPVFHGRDLFAPLAGCLAAGRLPDCGTRISAQQCVRSEEIIRPAEWPAAGDSCRATVVRVDHFGNLVSNLYAGFNSAAPETLKALITNQRSAFFRSTYGEVSPGDGICLLGSAGFLEIAIRNGSAAETYGLQCGDQFDVTATQ